MGQSPSSSTYNTEGIGLPFFQGKAEFGELYPTTRKWCTSPKKLAEAEDILISVRAPVGSTNLCPQKSCIGRGLAAVRPMHGLDVKYVLFALQANESVLRSQATGSTFEAISGKQLRNLLIPIPSIHDSNRIGKILETKFNTIREVRELLQKSLENCKTLRQSILKAACEGRLVPTEAELAAKEGREYETGEQLLTRILEERRKSFTGRGRYKEPELLHADYQFDLPKGWFIGTFDQVTINHDGKRIPLKSADRKARQGEYPYYGASGRIDWIDDYLFDGIYLLIGEDGANLITRSTPIAFLASGKFWVNNHAHVLQTTQYFDLTFLMNYINLIDLKPHVTGSAQPKMTQAAMNKLPVPVTPLAEQKRIVAEVERRFAILDQLEELIKTNLERCQTLRQSFLHKAFSFGDQEETESA